jgi:hypothetical protein
MNIRIIAIIYDTLIIAFDIETIINLIDLILLKILVSLTTRKIRKTLRKLSWEETFFFCPPAVESVSSSVGEAISIIENTIIKESKYVNASE